MIALPPTGYGQATQPTSQMPEAFGLTSDECRSITRDVQRRGLAGAPMTDAWLRTELLKAAVRKAVAPSSGAAPAR